MALTEKEIEKIEDEYYLALGKFVDAFASAEKWIHLAFFKFSKMKLDMVMAIKGGMRVSDLAPLTRRVLVINKFPKKTQREVDNCLNQFNLISTFRDRVLHRGASITDDGKYESTNFATMKSYDLLEQVNFDVNTIRDATADLLRIGVRIAQTSYPDLKSADPRVHMRYVHLPWLYKSVELKTPNRLPPAKPRTPSRHKKASRTK